MASIPDVSDPPGNHIFTTFSSYFGTTINSGSDGLDTTSRSHQERSESGESSPGPFAPLIVEQDINLSEYRDQQALAATDNTATQGNAVSHPSSHDFSLNQGNSASDNGDGEEMTEEEFFAQFGEDVPAWALPPPSADPQAQVTGSEELLEDDLEAQLDLELATGVDKNPMDITEADLEHQLDAELAAGDNDNPMEICEDDLKAQLNAEFEAESHREEAAEAARRKAKLQEELRIAAEKAALAAEYQFADNPCLFDEEPDILAGPDAAHVDKLLNDKFAALSHLEAQVNQITVKCYSSYERSAKRTKLTPKTKPRVPNNQPPPMRKTGELPQMYHHGEIDWNLLMKHMSLSTHGELAYCYRSLGLDVGRGKAVYDSLKTYLRIPGNSVDLSAKDVDSDEARRIVAGIAHRLLVDQRWGETYFQRPSLTSECKQITFGSDATEVFLEFTSLVYKAMKLEEKRKKGKAKQQEEQAAREVNQHPTSQAFATATYYSPQTQAHSQPSQQVSPSSLAPANNLPPVAKQKKPRRKANTTKAPMANHSPPVAATMHQQQQQQAPNRTPTAAAAAINNAVPRVVTQPQPTRQAFIAGMIVAPRSVVPARPL